MNNIVKYEVGGNEITLTPDVVKKYLVSGKGNVTDKELMMFFALCKMQKLNPFLREVYLIKYSDSSPATTVTGKETFLKRAARNPKYKGHETFISDDGKKATAKVYLEGYQVPITVQVDYDEYVGLKDEYANSAKTGKKIPNDIWKNKPKTMLKKVALVQALREAFPEDLGGMYSQEEINTVTHTLDTSPVEMTQGQPEPKPSALETMAEEAGEVKEPEKIEQDQPIVHKLTESQKQVLDGIPEEFRDPAMKELKIKKSIELLTDAECKKIMDKANELAT